MIDVLIADPDPAVRKALALLLSHRLGVVTIREAGDTEALICALEEFPPALLLLDWRMYGAPAPQTSRLLQKAYPGLKVVLLSVDKDDAQVAHETEAAFIHKGASPADIIAVLGPLLGKS